MDTLKKRVDELHTEIIEDISLLRQIDTKLYVLESQRNMRERSMRTHIAELADLVKSSNT